METFLIIHIIPITEISTTSIMHFSCFIKSSFELLRCTHTLILPIDTSIIYLIRQFQWQKHQSSYTSLVELKKNIGLKYGMYINKNITSTDSLIYVSSELYDPFAYDLYKMFMGSTIYLNDLLLKPEISAQHKIYNNSSVATSLFRNWNGIIVLCRLSSQ